MGGSAQQPLFCLAQMSHPFSKQQGEEVAYSMPLMNQKLHTSFLSTPFGRILVTWLRLAARKAEEYGLYLNLKVKVLLL